MKKLGKEYSLSFANQMKDVVQCERFVCGALKMVLRERESDASSSSIWREEARQKSLVPKWIGEKKG